ncbi:hypothetical protein Moror_14425, partial [Moniliophthora roreri MCA 2997]
MSASQLMAHQVEQKEQTFETLVPDYLHEFRAQFEDKEAERFPISRHYDHAIDLKPDFVPKDCKLYSLTVPEQQELDKFLSDNLRKGYIRKSKSPNASPFFFVGKKEKGKLRPTQDYRRLNDGTVKNAYPLPLISDLIDKLRGATIFSKLDLRNGYNNVRIKDGDQWKAAFKTNRGLFEPTVMFFGLMNSPATFQAFMDDILSDFMAEGWCLVYMDDILIYSTNEEEHRERSRRLLQRLKEQDLYLKPHKCEFDVTEVIFLGLVIRPGTIGMDPVKLAGIQDWPAPTTVTGVRSFTGFANFYRKFIGRYAEIARPLYDLTKKGVAFAWSDACQDAFETLKRKFSQQPLLQIPDSSKPFVIEADASKWASGAVLRQKGTDGEWHPCGYILHAFDAMERNYEIYDRELFAIVRALQTWRHYVMGNGFPVTILSDHKNLTYFRTAQKLNRRQARWSLLLSMFDLRLVHVPGTQMIQSDALSRRPDHILHEDKDNDNVILLPDTLFINMIDVDLQRRLKETLGKDDFHASALESLLDQGIPPIKSSLSDWKFEDDLLFYKDRVYVPNDVKLRREIVKTIHEGQLFGHPGQFGTIDLVGREFWWPGMAKFIKAFVDGCAPCQQMKVNTHPSVAGIMPIAGVPNAVPFQTLTMDLITDLPESDGSDSIMVVVDHSSTKGVIFIPCTKKLDATKAAELLFQHVYKRYSLAERIISDRDPRFAAEVFQEMARLLGVKHSMSTAYHPRTDGETERINQEVEIYLRFFCGKQQTEWSKHLHMAEFAHNNRTHSVTHHSPFFMTMGYHPRPLPTVFGKTNVPSVEKRLSELKRLREETSSMIELARKRVLERGNKKNDIFEKGQKVWLEGKNLDFGYPTKKLSPKREGPFEIEEVMGPVTYRLKLPRQWKIHPVFHVGLLSPYKETDEHGANYLEPPPDIVDGYEEFEIEAIEKSPSYNMSNQQATSSNLHDRPLPPPPIHTENPDQVHYTGPFCPSPFELLYLVNTGDHDDALRLGTEASPVHRITVDGLIRLREQRAALDRIIQETNTYSANLAYNATAGAAGGLVLQGPVTVPCPPAYSHDDDAPNVLNAAGTVPEGVCDANPNSPEFWMAHTAYVERIRRATELACVQYDRIPSIPTPSFGLSRPFNRTRQPTALHSSERLASSASSPTSLVYPEPPSPSSAGASDDGSIVVEHIPPSEPDSPPMYAASIGIRTPTPSDSGAEAIESDLESIHSPQIQGCDNCDPPAT